MMVERVGTGLSLGDRVSNETRFPTRPEPEQPQSARDASDQTDEREMRGCGRAGASKEHRALRGIGCVDSPDPAKLGTRHWAGCIVLVLIYKKLLALVGAAALRTLPLGATAPSQHFAV